MKRSCIAGLCLGAAILTAACSAVRDAAQVPAAAIAQPLAELTPPAPASVAEAAAYAKLRPMLQRNCLMCHAQQPLIPAYRVAPVGVVLETPEQLRALAPRILAVVQTTRQMPPEKYISMSDEDSNLLAATLRDVWPE